MVVGDPELRSYVAFQDDGFPYQRIDLDNEQREILRSLSIFIL